jgi:hypothetical protein
MAHVAQTACLTAAWPLMLCAVHKDLCGVFIFDKKIHRGGAEDAEKGFYNYLCVLCVSAVNFPFLRVILRKIGHEAPQGIEQPEKVLAVRLQRQSGQYTQSFAAMVKFFLDRIAQNGGMYKGVDLYKAAHHIQSGCIACAIVDDGEHRECVFERCDSLRQAGGDHQVDRRMAADPLHQIVQLTGAGRDQKKGPSLLCLGRFITHLLILPSDRNMIPDLHRRFGSDLARSTSYRLDPETMGCFSRSCCWWPTSVCGYPHHRIPDNGQGPSC